MGPKPVLGIKLSTIKTLLKGKVVKTHTIEWSQNSSGNLSTPQEWKYEVHNVASNWVLSLMKIRCSPCEKEE